MFNILILAGGSGSRAGGKNDVPKQYQHIDGLPMLRHSINTALSCKDLRELRVVIQPHHMDLYKNATKGFNLPDPIIGGRDTRQQSVFNGLQGFSHLKSDDKILIHDGARPFVSKNEIENISNALNNHDCATLCTPVVASLRTSTGAINRDGMFNVQTPQGFKYGIIKSAHKKMINSNFHDDASLAEACGHKISIVNGESANIKITTEKDMQMAQSQKETRSAFGFDVHAFGESGSVILCGIEIPHTRALIGHSDADVALHALTDAILGLSASGDIGVHFPPNNDNWKGVQSKIFVEKSLNILREKGGRLSFVDITIICEEPKITPYVAQMKESLSLIANIPTKRISIKATTTEGLGFTGRGEGIAVKALANAIF